MQRMTRAERGCERLPAHDHAGHDRQSPKVLTAREHTCVPKNVTLSLHRAAIAASFEGFKENPPFREHEGLSKGGIEACHPRLIPWTVNARAAAAVRREVSIDRHKLFQNMHLRHAVGLDPRELWSNPPKVSLRTGR